MHQVWIILNQLLHDGLHVLCCEHFVVEAHKFVGFALVTQLWSVSPVHVIIEVIDAHVSKLL